MNPATIMQLIQLGLVLKGAGLEIWGDLKSARTASDGTEDVELVISVRMSKLAGYLAQVQSDQAETLAEIARRESTI